jgi:hypothetical protein
LFDRCRIGRSNGTNCFPAAAEYDERALAPHAKLAPNILLAIEIDIEHCEILELRLRQNLAQRFMLGSAYRAPVSVDIDEDRPVLPLGSLECRCGEWLDGGRMSWRNGDDGSHEAQGGEIIPVHVCFPVFSISDAAERSTIDCQSTIRGKMGSGYMGAQGAGGLNQELSWFPTTPIF